VALADALDRVLTAPSMLPVIQPADQRFLPANV
jgi:hypothetical protein